MNKQFYGATSTKTNNLIFSDQNIGLVVEVVAISLFRQKRPISVGLEGRNGNRDSMWGRGIPSM